MDDNEFSDPSHFNPFILKHKRHLRDNPGDPKAWVKLGFLYEERASLTDRITKRNFVLRYIAMLTTLVCFLITILLLKSGLYIYLLLDKPLLFGLLMGSLVLILVNLIIIRYQFVNS
jgi:hypothetical protein